MKNMNEMSAAELRDLESVLKELIRTRQPVPEEICRSVKNGMMAMIEQLRSRRF